MAIKTFCLGSFNYVVANGEAYLNAEPLSDELNNLLNKEVKNDR